MRGRKQEEEPKKKKTYNKKSWTKSKTQREHELKLAMLDLYKSPWGFDLMLLTGAAAGYGISAIFEILESATNGISQSVAITQASESESQPIDSAWGNVIKRIPEAASGSGKMSTAGTISAAGVGAVKNNPVSGTFYNMFASEGETAIFDNAASNPLGSLLKFGGSVPRTFAQLCVLLLILRAVFGTGGMAEILKGIGEIVPL